MAIPPGAVSLPSPAPLVCCGFRQPPTTEHDAREPEWGTLADVTVQDRTLTAQSDRPQDFDPPTPFTTTDDSPALTHTNRPTGGIRIQADSMGSSVGDYQDRGGNGRNPENKRPIQT